jgi:hypothetical protein
LIVKEGFSGMRKTLIVVLASAIGGAVFVGTASPKQKPNLPQVKNLTQSLQLRGLERRGNDFVLQVQNVSDKPIAAYALALAELRLSEFLRRPIRPAQSREVFVDADSWDKAVPAAAGEQLITILALAFVDGSGQGDSKTVADISGYYLGELAENGRILAVVQAAAIRAETARDEDLPAELQRLKRQVEALSDGPEPGEPPTYWRGIQVAKQRSLYLISALAKGEMRDEFHRSDVDTRSFSPSEKLREGLRGIAESLARMRGPA